MTNQEIADFIAEKVMKWTLITVTVGHGAYRDAYRSAQKSIECYVDKWNPATDLNQAVKAAEGEG